MKRAIREHWKDFAAIVGLLVITIGVAGYILKLLGFHPAPALLGFVLGPRFEENFRRALLISRGDLMTFINRPISAAFLAVCVLLIAAQIYVRLRGSKGDVYLPPEKALHPGAEQEAAQPAPLSADATRTVPH